MERGGGVREAGVQGSRPRPREYICIACTIFFRYTCVLCFLVFLKVIFYCKVVAACLVNMVNMSAVS